MTDKQTQKILVLFLICFWALFFSGAFYASDEVIIAQLTSSIVEHQNLTFPETYGRTDSPYGILCSLLGIPPYVIYKIAYNIFNLESPVPVWNIYAFMNLLITGLLILVFFTFLRRIGLTTVQAAIASLLLGTTSALFPYSKTFFTEPLFALFLFLSFVSVCEYLDNPNLEPRAVLAGIWLGAAILTRFNAVFFFPVFVLFLTFHQKRLVLRRLILFTLPVLGALFITCLLNLAMRGSLLKTGYETSTFSGHMLVGLYGLLLSPGRGLVLYNPWIIISVALFPLFFQQKPRTAILSLLVFLITLFSYAKFWTWHGGWTMGCRFLVPMLPFLFLWLTPLWNKERSSNTYLYFWRSLSIPLFAISFIVQLGMALVNVLDYNNELYGILGAESPFLFIPQVSALAGIRYLIADGKYDLAIAICPSQSKPFIMILYIILLIMLFYIGSKLYKAFAAHLYFKLRQAQQFIRHYMFSLIIIVALALLYLISTLLAGPRGLLLTKTDNIMSFQLDQHIRVNESVQQGRADRYQWSGFLEAPTERNYIFYLKALGTYKVYLDGQLLFLNQEKIPQHLPRKNVDLTRGIYHVVIEYEPYIDDKAVFYMYWTIPGESRYIEPLAAEYLFPSLPTSTAHFYTRIKRHLWLLIILVLIPVIAIENLNKKKA